MLARRNIQRAFMRNRRPTLFHFRIHNYIKESERIFVLKRLYS